MKKAIIILTLILTSTAKGVEMVEPAGSIENGMGGTSLAISSLNGSLFTNPALYSYNYVYAMELFGYLSPSLTYGGRISIIDTVSSPVSGGLSYSYSEGMNKGDIKTQFLFNLSKAYNSLSGGVNFKYYTLRRPIIDNVFLMDIGIGVKLYKNIFRVGAVAENIVQYGLRDENRTVKRGYGAGIGGSAINKVVWGFDYLRRGATNTYRGGLQVLFFRSAIGVSGGYSYSTNGKKWFGVGLHIYGPRLILSYSFSRDISEEDNYHVISLIFVPRR